MGKQVMEVLKAEAIGHYQLVGHSLGGYVGCYLLENDPRLEHLVLLHSHPWADSPAKKTDRERVSELVKTKAAFFIREAIPNLFAHATLHHLAIEKYCSIADQMLPEAISWSTLAMRDRPSSEALLQRFNDRVSIVQGQLDPLIPNEELRRFAEQASIGFHEIADCGHMGQEEQPEAIKNILLALLG
jgi:pimeloyl-ACP methyl ester carboxylesterase